MIKVFPFGYRERFAITAEQAVISPIAALLELRCPTNVSRLVMTIRIGPAIQAVFGTWSFTQICTKANAASAVSSSMPEPSQEARQILTGLELDLDRAFLADQLGQLLADLQFGRKHRLLLAAYDDNVTPWIVHRGFRRLGFIHLDQRFYVSLARQAALGRGFRLQLFDAFAHSWLT